MCDNSSAASLGFVPWSDITGVQEGKNVLEHKLIILVVKNPDAYINKAPRLHESRPVLYKQLGSPIVITAGNQEIESHLLVSILKSELVRMSLGYGQ